jgi:copper chaperone CopZ
MTAATDKTAPTSAVSSIELAVSGMTCASCSARIEKRLSKLDGVTATVNYSTEKAKVTYTGDVTPADLIAAVEKAGYSARLPAPPKTTEADQLVPSVADDHVRDLPQVVLVALGVVPATDWLLGSGLDLGPHGAVTVDAQHRVIDWPGVYAAGDLAAVPGPDGEPVRVEHWGAALSQGRAAGRAALADLGLAEPHYAPAAKLPSCSTYVHSTKLTILGWPHRATGELPLQGVAGDDRFAVALSDQRHRLVAAVGVGGARAVNKTRVLLERQAAVNELALEPVVGP